ncbi:MAG TPA: sensor histidine kinase [Herpetosiphonaceae bacterium]
MSYPDEPQIPVTSEGAALCSRVLGRLCQTTGASAARVLADDGVASVVVAAASAGFQADGSRPALSIALPSADPGLRITLEVSTEQPWSAEHTTLAEAIGDLVGPLLQVDALRYECDRERAASRRLLHIIEQETGRIIRDIHDGPVQNIFAALSQLQLLARQLERHPELAEAELKIGRVVGLLEHALNDIRGSMGTHRPPEFARRDLRALIEGLLIQYEELTGYEVALAVSEPLPALHLPAKVALYRIVQEALSNATRHGGARRPEVMLRPSGDGVELVVADDGCGFEPELVLARSADTAAHLGLSGMQERVQLLGGTIEIWSRPGQGTRITILVPSS